MKKTVPLDKIVETVASLGVPGLMLLTALGGSGLTGAAAITTALGSLGPGGMIGGVATLGVALLLVRGISEFGFDAILSNVVKQLYKQGETKETIKQKIEGYHVAKSLRFKLVGMLDSLPEEETASQALAVRWKKHCRFRQCSFTRFGSHSLNAIILYNNYFLPSSTKSCHELPKNAFFCQSCQTIDFGICM